MGAILLALQTGCRFRFDAVDGVPDASVVADAMIDAGTSIDSPPGPAPLVQIIDDVGLSTDLLVCLDAGDTSSYDGVSQTWVNTAPGGVGTSFFRGADVGVSGDDPAFSGNAGGLSPNEYFTLDGGDWFQAAATDWGEQAFHLDDGRVTVLAMVFSTGAARFPLFSDCRCGTSGVTTPGIHAGRGSDNLVHWYQEGNTNSGYQTSSTAIYPLGVWGFAAVATSANGTTSDLVFATNRTIESLPGQSENYATGPADRRAAIGADGGGANPTDAGARITMLAVWRRALSPTELVALYDAIKARRFPALP